MTARVYCSLSVVLLCLSACLTDAGAKPGECPSTKSVTGTCVDSCAFDRDCPFNEKCCSNGCGRQCMAPYAVKPEAKQPKPEAKQPKPEAKQPKPEAKQPKPEAKQPKPEAKQPKPEAKQPKPEAKQPKPEAKQPKPVVCANCHQNPGQGHRDHGCHCSKDQGQGGPLHGSKGQGHGGKDQGQGHGGPPPRW